MQFSAAAHRVHQPAATEQLFAEPVNRCGIPDHGTVIVDPAEWHQRVVEIADHGVRIIHERIGKIGGYDLARARIAAIYIVYGSAPIRRNRKPALLLYAADPIQFRRPTVVADNFQSGIDFFEPLRHANKVYDALFF